jgi:hypothetical protein
MSVSQKLHYPDRIFLLLLCQVKVGFLFPFANQENMSIYGSWQCIYVYVYVIVDVNINVGIHYLDCLRSLDFRSPVSPLLLMQFLHRSCLKNSGCCIRVDVSHHAEDRKCCGNLFECRDWRILAHGHMGSSSWRALQVSLQDGRALIGGNLF